MATDVDSVMEAPSAPPPLSSGQPHSQSQQEIIERHKNLKRRFDELEEEFNSETQGSAERNVRMREERDHLLGEIQELEKKAKFSPNLAASLALLAASTTQTPRREEGGLNGDEARGTRKGRASVAAPSNHTNDSSRMPSQTSIDQDIRIGQPRIDSAQDVEMENGVGGRDSTVVENQQISGKNSGAHPPKTTTSNNGNASSTPESSTSTSEAGVHRVPLSSSTLAHALGPTSSTALLPSDAPPSSSNSSHTNLSQHSPSMESILKVAEAAVAAQNAANQAKLTGMSSRQSNSTPDPNLDPSLFSDTSTEPAASERSAGNNTPAAAAKPTPPHVDTTTTNSNPTASSSTATPTSVATPSSSLSNNPYLSLSTNLLSRATSGSTTPNGHPMFIPYPLFYPPGTPVTPNSPSYPIPYNPYYYLAAPPNGMYPPPGNFPPPPPAQQQRPPPAEPQRVKPKRLKAHTVTTRSFSIPMVPRDKKGKPILPLNVGIMTVINLGEVCMREHFHTERYIFPVGYEVTRRYLSTVDPTVEVVYHCTILDGGDGPKFQIIPSDRPDKPIIAGTATGAWSNIVKQANAIRNRQHSNSVSGPDFFGLGQNTIKHLIQELPNADRLRDYVWQNFVEGGPLGGRHAAVIPALPEEYDASLPIGAYYPKRDTNPNPNLPRGMSHYPQHIIAQAEAQKLQRLAAQQQQSQQQQPIPGPPGSGSSSTPTSQHITNSDPQHDPSNTNGMPVGAPAALNIQQYQPPQNPDQTQTQGQPAPAAPEKRATRSSAAMSTSPSSTARQTRARGNQQQIPASTVNGVEATTVNADGTMPTTFASIMNAYPAPGISAMSGQPATSTT